MSYSLERVQVARAEQAGQFLDEFVPRVRNQSLGLAATSIHPYNVFPEISDNGSGELHVSTHELDQLSEGLFSVTVQATTGVTQEDIHPVYTVTDNKGRGRHIDPSYPEELESTTLHHHYTPAGRGVVRVARVLCEPDELIALAHGYEDEVAEMLYPQFDEVAASLEFNTGDVLTWPTFGQIVNGNPVYPLMHEFIRGTYKRQLIINGYSV